LQVLYRLISGMHSSITTSIIQNYFNETSGAWGPNLPFFKARFVGEKVCPGFKFSN
jgi:ERO1-like protein beta